MSQTRSRLGRAALAGSAALLLALGAPAAAFAAPPGNNGDIKVHNLTTGVDDDRNEPMVGCFYIDAFGFDAGQQLKWSVHTGTRGKQGPEVAGGAATFNPTPPHKGQDISGPIKLPKGKYVVLEKSLPGDKSKEIEVTEDCNQGIPLADGRVVGLTGAVAAPAVLGYFLWRRRNSRTA